MEAKGIAIFPANVAFNKKKQMLFLLNWKISF